MITSSYEVQALHNAHVRQLRREAATAHRKVILLPFRLLLVLAAYGIISSIWPSPTEPLEPQVYEAGQQRIIEFMSAEP